MVKLLGVGLLAVQVAQATSNGMLSAISWGDQRIDVFGVAPDDSIWHKYHGPVGFEPRPNFETMNGTVAGAPASVTWGTDRLDYFVVGKNTRQAYHKFWDSQGNNWMPLGKYHEELKGKFTSDLATASWGTGRLDVVGRGDDMAYKHSWFDGSNWNDWEDFGGNFSSAPSVVSWGNSRLDVFGIDSSGKLLHKYFNSESWVPGITDWEDMGGSPFVGTPVCTSWGLGRMDLWAVGGNNELYHTVWDGSYYSGWENLGGSFDTAPQVVNWESGRIDIVGRNRTDGSYVYKYYSGGTGWQPSYNTWYTKGGSFASEPAITSWSKDNLNILGIDTDGLLRWQMWNQGNWFPGFDGYYSLGTTKDPYSSSEEPDREPAVALKDAQVPIGVAW